MAFRKLRGRLRSTFSRRKKGSKKRYSKKSKFGMIALLALPVVAYFAIPKVKAWVDTKIFKKQG